jgi:hypothetical protein
MSDFSGKRVGSTPMKDVSGGRAISLQETVGRTVARVESGKTEGIYGDEPMIILHFTDNTHHTIVLPSEESAGQKEVDPSECPGWLITENGDIEPCKVCSDPNDIDKAYDLAAAWTRSLPKHPRHQDHDECSGCCGFDAFRCEGSVNYGPYAILRDEGSGVFGDDDTPAQEAARRLYAERWAACAAPDFASKRVGSAHAEDVVGGRARCSVCGWVDEADPSDSTVREWHGDSFGDEPALRAPPVTLELAPKEGEERAPVAPADDLAERVRLEPRGAE